MREYYDREELIEALMMYTWRDTDGWEIDDTDVKRAFIEEWLSIAPAASVCSERYAKKVKFYNAPWTGNKFTTCTACYGKVGPRDKFCKHCGAKFVEGETNDNHG